MPDTEKSLQVTDFTTLLGLFAYRLQPVERTKICGVLIQVWCQARQARRNLWCPRKCQARQARPDPWYPL